MDIENKYGTLNAQIGLLKLLKAFHSFCSQNNIRYSLAYGSLLGAIRHRGFIPWDDDLDVFVDRNNYNHLIDALKGDPVLGVERNSIDSLWVDRVRIKDNRIIGEGQYRPTLDILVLDNVPDGIVARKIKQLLVMMLQGMIKPKLNLKKGSFIIKICSLGTFIVGRLFPIKWKKEWYRRVSQIGDSRSSTFIANYNGEFTDIKRNYPNDIMNHIIEHVFEDTNASIVEAYDLCLTIQFGDYMTPPKESDRHPSHGGGEVYK